MVVEDLFNIDDHSIGYNFSFFFVRTSRLVFKLKDYDKEAAYD